MTMNEFVALPPVTQCCIVVFGSMLAAYALWIFRKILKDVLG